MADGPYTALFGITAEVQGEVVHADESSEPVVATHTTTYGLNADVHGTVEHANPELWDGDQLKEQG